MIIYVLYLHRLWSVVLKDASCVALKSEVQEEYIAALLSCFINHTLICEFLCSLSVILH